MDAPPPRLETARLILRPPTPEDAPALALHALEEREFLRRWSPERKPEFFTEAFWREEAERAEEARRAGTRLVLYLFDRERPGEIVGRVTLSNVVRGVFQAAHLGYELRERRQGKGLMEEALGAVIAHAFGPMNLHRLMANYMTSNKRSARLLDRLGFTKEGVAKDYLRIAGRWEDHVLTSLVNPHWQ